MKPPKAHNTNGFTTYEHLTTPKDLAFAAMHQIAQLHWPAHTSIWDNLVPQHTAPRVVDIGPGYMGVWGEATKYVYPAAHVTGVEYDEKWVNGPGRKHYTEWITMDARLYKPEQPFDIVVSNPPFSLAADMIQWGWEHLASRGAMVMLLRLAFLASQKRQALWAKMAPNYVYVLGERPSFTGDVVTGTGSSDTKTEYALLVWNKSHPPHNTSVLRYGFKWRGFCAQNKVSGHDNQ